MQNIKNNEVVEILKEIVSKIDCKERIDITKVKFQHHEASEVEPLMNESDFNALLEDVRLTGLIHSPVILYHNKIIDGRHRQKIAIKLNLSLPVIKLTGEYSKNGLKEYVRSVHMNRNKSRVQKEIQAFKYKKTVAGVTYESAAIRYGVKERSIKHITTLYNLLEKHGYEKDFEEVVMKLEMGMTLLPKDFEWLSKSTSSFSSSIKQFKEFIERVEDEKSKDSFDPTEYEKVVNKETGEVIIKEIKKDDNVFQVNSIDLEAILQELKELRKEVKQLKEENRLLREENKKLKEENNRLKNKQTLSIFDSIKNADSASIDSDDKIIKGEDDES
jgi:cell division protein FtsB